MKIFMQILWRIRALEITGSSDCRRNCCSFCKRENRANVWGSGEPLGRVLGAADMPRYLSLPNFNEIIRLAKVD
jgi:hypothetical protein